MRAPFAFVLLLAILCQLANSPLLAGTEPDASFMDSPFYFGAGPGMEPSSTGHTVRRMLAPLSEGKLTSKKLDAGQWLLTVDKHDPMTRTGLKKNSGPLPMM